MYHNSDSHLNKVVAWDADTKQPCSTEIICQDCHEVEEHIDNISKQYDLENYETYKKDVEYFWSSGAINELEADGMLTVDREERREDGSLSYQSMRILTEEEFTNRFKRFIQTDYPIQDDVWASRRWNKDRTDYEDLSGTDQDLIAEECRDSWGKNEIIINEEDKDSLPF
jgi:hypothetical protein